MPSKTIEEFLKTARPEQLAELKKDGQDLQRNGVQVKPDNYGPQTPARIGESRPHATPPKLNESLVPDQKRENAMDRVMAAETKAQAPSQDKKKDQEHER